MGGESPWWLDWILKKNPHYLSINLSTIYPLSIPMISPLFRIFSHCTSIISKNLPMVYHLPTKQEIRSYPACLIPLYPHICWMNPYLHTYIPRSHKNVYFTTATFNRGKPGSHCSGHPKARTWAMDNSPFLNDFPIWKPHNEFRDKFIKKQNLHLWGISLVPSS